MALQILRKCPACRVWNWQKVSDGKPPIAQCANCRHAWPCRVTNAERERSGVDMERCDG
jgi:hypothetical protein